MNAFHDFESNQRMKEPPATLATVEQIKGWKQISSHPPHKASQPGVLCVDIHPEKQELTITGGVDKTAVVLNRRTGKKEVRFFLCLCLFCFSFFFSFSLKEVTFISKQSGLRTHPSFFGSFFTSTYFFFTGHVGWTYQESFFRHISPCR
jgi:hypothetical protein